MYNKKYYQNPKDPNLFANKYRVKSTRLIDRDYTRPGYYFITVCVHQKYPFFGEINHGKMILSKIGLIIDKLWQEIPIHCKNVILDEFIIMPDHLHGIIQIIGTFDVETRLIASLQNPPIASLQNNIFEYHNDPGGVTGERNPMLENKSLGAIIRAYKSRCKYLINLKYPAAYFYWQPRYYERVIRSSEELYKIQEYIKNNPKNWKYG